MSHILPNSILLIIVENGIDVISPQNFNPRYTIMSLVCVYFIAFKYILDFLNRTEINVLWGLIVIINDINYILRQLFLVFLFFIDRNGVWFFILLPSKNFILNFCWTRSFVLNLLFNDLFGFLNTFLDCFFNLFGKKIDRVSWKYKLVIKKIRYINVTRRKANPKLS